MFHIGDAVSVVKAKKQSTGMAVDTKWKQHGARHLGKEIGAKESPEDAYDSVVVDDDVTMSKIRATILSNDRNSCGSSIEKPMDNS